MNDLTETTTEPEIITEPSSENELFSEEETEVNTEINSESEGAAEPVEQLPDMSDNEIHELFAVLGVDLDYTPQNAFQCFTMSLQFIAALWFIGWLVKYVFQLMRQSFTIGR